MPPPWTKTILKRARDVWWFLRQFRFRPRRFIHSTRHWLAQERLAHTEDENRYRGWYWPVYAEEKRLHPRVAEIKAIPHPQMRALYIQQFQAAGVYYLPDSYIYSEWGAVISRQNELFTEFLQFYTAKSLKKSRFGRPFGLVARHVERFQPWVAILAAPGVPENYYHWVLNILPRVRLLQEFRPIIEQYAIPSPLSPYQEESLSLLDIPKERCLPLDRHRKVYCERLLVPSLPGGDGHTPDWAIQFLRDAYLPKEPPRPPARRIYIPRGATLRRPVVNEAEIEAFFRQQGYEVISPEKLTFRQQIDLFHGSEIIVAPHGAGLVNMVFSVRAHILEILNPASISPCYCSLALQCGHGYRELLGAAVPARMSGEFNAMSVALPELERAVAEIERLAGKANPA